MDTEGFEMVQYRPQSRCTANEDDTTCFEQALAIKSVISDVGLSAGVKSAKSDRQEIMIGNTEKR